MSADDFFDENNLEDGGAELIEEESIDCPICYDPLDITDLCFKPCPCGFQTCRFCWNHINENMNGKCPGCRTPYNPDKYTFTQPDPAKLQRAAQSSKSSKDKAKRRRDDVSARRRLQDLRVIQRNLVYVTNIALEIAKEEILKKHEYFGQYGKVIKLVVNRSHVYQGVSVSCYVTYAKPEDAFRCIDAVDGAELSGRILHASFGTTKYCSNFMKARPCNNPECMYLHELGDDKDSFTKEDMQVSKHIIRNQEQAEQIMTLLASPSCPKPPRKLGILPKLPPPREDWSGMLQKHISGSFGMGSSSVDESGWRTQSLGVSAPQQSHQENYHSNNASSGWKTQSQSIPVASTTSKGPQRGGPSPAPRYSPEDQSDEQPVVPPVSNAKKTSRAAVVEQEHHQPAPSGKQVWKTKSQPAKPVAPPVIDDSDFPPPQASKTAPQKQPEKATAPQPTTAAPTTSAEIESASSLSKSSGGGVWKVVPTPAPVSIQAEIQKSEDLKKQQELKQSRTPTKPAPGSVLPSSASWASRNGGKPGKGDDSYPDDGLPHPSPMPSENRPLGASKEIPQDPMMNLPPGHLPFALPPPIPGLPLLDPGLLAASPELLAEWLRVASDLLRKEMPDDPNDLAAAVLAASMPPMPAHGMPGGVPGSPMGPGKPNSRFQFARQAGAPEPPIDAESGLPVEDDKRNSLRALLPNVSIKFSENQQGGAVPPPGSVKQPPGLPGMAANQPLLWSNQPVHAPQVWRQDPRFPPQNIRPQDGFPQAPAAQPAIWGPNISDQALFQLLAMPQNPPFVNWAGPPGFPQPGPNPNPNNKK